MTTERAFVALGSNEGDAHAHLRTALAALDRDGCRVAACSRLGWSHYVGIVEGQRPAPVLNAVAEIRTSLDVDTFHARLHALEDEAGRVRDGRPERTLDLDLLTFGDVVRTDASLTLPHPRCLARGFVLSPWMEIAPLFRVPGTSATVVEHAAALRVPDPGPATDLEPAFAAPFADRGAACEVLRDREALDAWRGLRQGRVGVVMTMGALHAGHASLVQRAAAECDAVLATVFVNPTQFAAGEDLDRYPRTFEADCALLARHGAHAVYAPTAAELYPDGVAADVEPGDAAEGYEGAERPTHFAGVATVVTKLWDATRADVSYFGRKDAQQLAVLRQVRDRLGLPVEVVGCPTVRAIEGLALSSRNRYLEDAQMLLARKLSTVLEVLRISAAVCAAPAGAYSVEEDLATVRALLEKDSLDVDYIDVVDADTMRPVRALDGPALAIGAIRLGGVRLIDNRWIAPPARPHA